MSKFQVGDEVIAPTVFNGIGKVTNTNFAETFCITVECDLDEYHFTQSGASNGEVGTPTLYHAGTKITIEEVQPVRWPWVNVYQGNLGYIFAGDSFKTKEEALERYNTGSSIYLHTCQLKPEE